MIWCGATFTTNNREVYSGNRQDSHKMSVAIVLHPPQICQVRSECVTCTFRASCCSARLSRNRYRFLCPGLGWGEGGGGSRERNVLFNDALNTFYLRLYGVRHMVKDHSDSEKGNPLPPHRLLLSINSKGSFKHTVTYHFSDLQEVYSGNRQIHTKCQQVANVTV